MMIPSFLINPLYRVVNKSADGKPSGQHTRTARGDYDSYGSHIDYFEPSPVDISTDESEEPFPATADCPPICGESGNDESNPYQPSAEEYSAGYHSDEDQSAEVGPENHDLEGNVMWTSE